MNVEQVEQLIVEIIGERPVRIERKTFGQINIVYDVEMRGPDLIVRTNEDPAILEGTASNLNILAALGLPVSRLIAADVSKRKYPAAYMILYKIPGFDLRFELGKMTRRQMTALAEQIVDMQRKVASLPPGAGHGWVPINGTGPYGNWRDIVIRDMDNHLKEGSVNLTHYEIRPILTAAERLRPYFEQIRPCCFLDDVTIKNVIVLDGELQGIIDLDWVCYGDPLYMLGLTEAAIVSDIGEGDALFYVEELCRIWGISRIQRGVVHFYMIVHGMNFLKHVQDDRYEGVRERLLRVIRAKLSKLGK